MPQETRRPMTLVHSHEIMKFRILTDFNQKRTRIFQKKVPTAIGIPTQPSPTYGKSYQPLKTDMPGTVSTCGTATKLHSTQDHTLEEHHVTLAANVADQPRSVVSR